MEGTRKTEAMQPSAMKKEDFAALWKSIHLKVTDTYDVPPEILWVNGSTIGTLGNFSASTGKAKSKKTFNISTIVAAALTNDEVLHYSACLPSNKRKILYVDTEQSKYHCHKVMERILRLAGLPTDQDRDDFVFIVLREQTPDMRKRIIGYMLENMQGDLLPGNEDESLKVLPENSGSQAFCSYIEIRSEYLSDSQYSRPGEYLVYRFYPGEDPGNFDICRNSEYKIRIMPEGSGLNGTEWRIDKSGIESFARTLELSYSSLNFSYAGESTVIRPYLTPEGSGDTRLYWDSDDKSVATVSGDGTVTARGEGTCRIICYAADGSGCSAECAVTVRFSPYYMKIFPGNFIRCRKGDIVEISCEYFPLSAPFDIGTEELEYDKSRGIYDYAIGEDGRSVTLYTMERGSGLLYMEAGYPVNQAEMIVVVID